jgi:hypothetical protein
MLRQVHVSEVNARSKHDPLSYSSILAFQEVAHFIPEHIPMVLETPVSEEDMESEIARVRDALPLDTNKSCLRNEELAGLAESRPSRLFCLSS